MIRARSWSVIMLQVIGRFTRPGRHRPGFRCGRGSRLPRCDPIGMPNVLTAGVSVAALAGLLDSMVRTIHIRYCSLIDT